MWKRFSSCVGLLLLAVSLRAPQAGGAGPPVRYQLDLRQPESHLIRVTMIAPDTGPETEIQFPAWNALYQIRDFVKNVQELQARCDGKALPLTRLDFDTWRTGLQPCGKLELRYAVYADEESIFSAVLNEQHAFLNFALVLFYLPRERKRAAHLSFLLPPGWNLATLLDAGPNPGEYEAPDYDSLADAPAEAGTFQLYTYEQNATTYRVVVFADPAAYSPQRLLASLEKITETETGLMRDVPFKSYTFIFHFLPAGGGGGMEHKYGTAISLPAQDLRDHWGRLEGTAAHEFFHLWNVKRIRPQGLEPVDYVRGNDTRDLWFSEGVTSTYGELTLVRSGLITRQEFYRRVADQIGQLQSRPARLFQSLEESGEEAWLEKYADYFRPERSISYYNKGELVGFLLDLAIRHWSDNRYSLDDVMRRLNRDFARPGRYFTDADLEAIIRTLAPSFSGLHDFFQEFVFGWRELDYDTCLGYAGLRLNQENVEQASLGFQARRAPDGTIRVDSVEPGSDAAQKGLKAGDFLLKMDGRPLTGLPERALAGLKPGEKVAFQVSRQSKIMNLKIPLGSRRETVYRITEAPNTTPDQLRVREGWLGRK